MPPPKPPCIEKYYAGDLPKPYVIPKGTILYTGARDTFPTSKDNQRLPSTAPDATYYFKYFTPNIEIAKQFATLDLKSSSTNGYVAIYRVLQDIPILLNTPSQSLYFNTPENYASPEAQCLCTGGYHGYATMIQNGIEDIGLCANLEEYLELVEFTTVKSSLKNKTRFGGRKTKRHRCKRTNKKRYSQ
jgi:hypothetical protein